MFSSTCPANVGQLDYADFTIDAATSTSFLHVPGDGTASFQCQLDETAFDCVQRDPKLEDYRPSIDAVITVRAADKGVFADVAHARGSETGGMDCSGTQCSSFGSASTFPCSFIVNFEMSAL